MHRRGRIEHEFDIDAAKYTSSLHFDKEILESVILVNIAHVRLLEKAGIIPSELAEKAERYLQEMLAKPPSLDDPRYEDVHMVIEAELTKYVPQIGASLALGKSRNDAVVTAIKLRLKERLLSFHKNCLTFCDAVLRKALAESETIFPVYTHLQRAAPATFGFVMHSYAVRLIKALQHLKVVYELSDESPLGSAAVAGTSVPLDREYSASLLGFSRISQNALESTTSRDFIIAALSCLTLIALILSSLSEELVIFSSEEFALIEFPEEFSATSSIMPQKRNPVVVEISRTKLAELLGLLTSTTVMAARQASGYSLDLQQITPKLWQALEIMEETLHMMTKLIPSLKINKDRCMAACSPPTGIVEVANYLSLKHKIPFRDAHAFAGRISRLLYEGGLNENLLQKTKAEFNTNIPLTLDELMNLMEPKRVVHSYMTVGSANPELVRHAVKDSMMNLEEEKRWVRNKMVNLEYALNKLKGQSCLRKTNNSK
ncbi:MAG: argininosuccinate lyase [Nitrososphaerota archaeon]